ncbi:hypothetical protein K469DRAFT_726183 [Zopfia rhizophila CBS 207.26]|uniref:Integrase catalytic domain-containing protein n=1 Tax=Zopfia rhizophila CBS 207.26 TaxID=1314779 RepID=A0A6A6E460_9PEZI|nr:hypothetical protein K469DRAFT_726183 [Zopfia rhizophila CBS 207.26]
MMKRQPYYILPSQNSDIFYLNNRPVIYVVDSIDIYLGPLKTLRHDAGKNFASSEFRLKASSIAISVKEIPVKAYNSVGKIKRYHTPLRQAFDIIRSKSGTSMTLDNALQLVVKVVNNTAGLNGFIPTLLVFRAYLRMTKISLPLPDVYERAEAIRKREVLGWTGPFKLLDVNNKTCIVNIPHGLT